MTEAFLHYTSLAHALTDIFGSGISISHTDRLSGGDINKAYALILSNGKRVFMKANAKKKRRFFYRRSGRSFCDRIDGNDRRSARFGRGYGRRRDSRLFFFAPRPYRFRRKKRFILGGFRRLARISAQGGLHFFFFR